MIDFASECGLHGKEKLHFYFNLTIAYIFRRKCRFCDSDGMQGYWEREVCSECDGWHLTWNWNTRSRIINFLRHKNWHDVWIYEYQHNKANIIERGFP